MPIVIIIIALAVLGAGVFFLNKDDSTVAEVNEPATEELIENEDGKVEDGEAMEETGDGEESEDEPDGEAMEEGSEVMEETGEAMEETSASLYKDGEYQSTATYRTPKQTTQTIDVTITLENDVVTASDIRYDNSDGFSNDFQKGFDGGYESLVIGKSLDDIDLGRVGGSSLTPGAFNEAVGNIKNEAKS